MSCCTPSSGRDAASAPAAGLAPVAASATARRPDAVAIPGGTGLWGTASPLIRSDGEGPLRETPIAPFHLSRGAITVDEFAAFVADTAYVTEAERFGWSFVFFSQVCENVGPTRGVPSAPWWRRVDGACWHRIGGPACPVAQARGDHPVVHVSWNDAAAYAAWAGGRLPTEREWEHAARGGLGDVRFPWGDAEPDDESSFPCNIWQGRFPQVDTGRDGYTTTAPALSFEPNGYGLHNLVGNVWEWTADPFALPARRVGTRHVPRGTTGEKLAKGGSFLCHKSYCFRYRIAARIGVSADSATTHTGFRVAWDPASA